MNKVHHRRHCSALQLASATTTSPYVDSCTLYLPERHMSSGTHLLSDCRRTRPSLHTQPGKQASLHIWGFGFLQVGGHPMHSMKTSSSVRHTFGCGSTMTSTLLKHGWWFSPCVFWPHTNLRRGTMSCIEFIYTLNTDHATSKNQITGH